MKSGSEIESLQKMKKYCFQKVKYNFPYPKEKLSIPIHSANKQIKFYLDIRPARNGCVKITFQNRAGKILILFRLDLNGKPHRNPDGTKISGNHLHICTEKTGDKVAVELPQQFAACKDKFDYLDKFMDYCNIIKKPLIEGRLPFYEKV